MKKATCFLLFGFLLFSSVYGVQAEEKIDASLIKETVLAAAADVSATYISNNLESYAFVIKSDKGVKVLLNGAEGKEYVSVQEVIFAPDGRCGYVAKTKKQYFVVDETKVLGKFDDEVKEGSLIYTGDGKHLLYVVGGNGATLYDGKKEQKEFDEIREVYVAQAGACYCYEGIENNMISFFVNGKECKTFSSGSCIEYSLDGKHLFFNATSFSGDEEKGGIVIDMKSVGEMHGWATGDFAFSPDSKKWGATADQTLNLYNMDTDTITRKNEYHLVYLSGKQIGKYDSASNFTFAPNSKDYAYLAKSGETTSIYLNGKKYMEDVEGGMMSHLAISPDGKRVMLKGLDKIYVDKEEMNSGMDCLTSKCFFNGKNEFVQFQTSDDKVALLVEGQEEFYVEEASMGGSFIAYSDTGSNYAIVAKVEEKYQVYMDGKLVGEYDDILVSEPRKKYAESYDEDDEETFKGPEGFEGKMPDMKKTFSSIGAIENKEGYTTNSLIFKGKTLVFFAKKKGNLVKIEVSAE